MAELRLEVDLSDRELVAFDGESEIARYSVAVGTDKYPTPEGTFRIHKVVWNPPWAPPDSPWAKGKEPLPPGHPDNPMKRVKIFFSEPDYYIHGTDAEDSLGKAESHGCIRMSPGEATRLAQLVMTHGGKPMPEPWYRRIFHRRTTKVVILAEPIRIDIHA
jgi:lipoprotein-anchoring transpeptidase ErfK/SrfK